DDDYVEGGNGKDDCHGGLGNDELMGGRGHDQLNGDAGDNLIDGDPGKDGMLNGIHADLKNEFRSLFSGPNNESGQAKYDTRNDGGDLKTKFQVDVDHLAALSTFDVIVDNVTVGQITTDLSGAGQLKLSSNPSGGGEVA